MTVREIAGKYKVDYTGVSDRINLLVLPIEIKDLLVRRRTKTMPMKSVSSANLLTSENFDFLQCCPDQAGHESQTEAQGGKKQVLLKLWCHSLRSLMAGNPWPSIIQSNSFFVSIPNAVIISGGIVILY